MGFVLYVHTEDVLRPGGLFLVLIDVMLRSTVLYIVCCWRLVRLFTNPISEVKDLAADLCFVLCKENGKQYSLQWKSFYIHSVKTYTLKGQAILNIVTWPILLNYSQVLKILEEF